MAQVMELLEQERKRRDMSAEKFANLIGMTAATYSRQHTGKHNLGMDSFRRYAAYAREAGNLELLKALGAFALGVEPEHLTIKVSNYK